MKVLLTTTACTLALAVAACGPTQKPAARAALDCPQNHKELTRVSVSADGKTCAYRTRTGDEVTLQLLPTAGDPDAALRTLEAQLVPAVAAGEPAATAPDAGVEAAAADASKAAAEAAQDAAADAGDTDEPQNVEVNGGPVHVSVKDDPNGGGESARISLPGIHINAENERADIRVAGVQINANGDDATIRMFRNVRLKGEAFSREKRGVRATYIRTGPGLPGGARTIGYEAGGPKAGPLTVAVIRAREGEHDGHDEIFKAVQDLVRRNGGV